jgi:hypothetical protein
MQIQVWIYTSVAQLKIQNSYTRSTLGVLDNMRTVRLGAQAVLNLLSGVWTFYLQEKDMDHGQSMVAKAGSWSVFYKHSAAQLSGWQPT